MFTTNLQHASKILDKQQGDKQLNMDTSGFMAYISETTHNAAHYLHSLQQFHPLVQAQIVSECEHPNLQYYEFLSSIQLIICEQAKDEITNILQHQAGPNEQARAQQILQTATIVPNSISLRCQTLRITKNVKPSDILVFGTADALQIPTLTSDAKFLRASAQQGVAFDAIVNPARALLGK